MKIIDIQQAYRQKFERQSRVTGLEIDAAGHCAHVGKISPGCYGCFSAILCYGVRLGEGVGLPNVCNMNCTHCFEDREIRQTYRVPSNWKMAETAKGDILKYFIQYNLLKSAFVIYNFTGIVEPLFYIPVIEQYMEYLKNDIEKDILKVKGWAKVYTNGTLLNREMALRLRDIGINEVRINPSASGFSKQVYKNIEIAVQLIPVVTIEVPSWPLYRKSLFKMLPIINDLGVSHLDICQVEMGSLECYNRIQKALPDAMIYQGKYMMLDDGGMVEDIMQEVIDKKYSYSVIDCNAFVKQIYTNTFVKNFFHQHCDTINFESICDSNKTKTLSS